jgi:TolB-like protein/Tfp pilus assembly protein PilF
MNPSNFFAELKRRNVYKVAVAYAVVAWLLIQAGSIFLPTFDAPPWVMKIFIIVIIFGFPVALVLAWAFEITPEGIKRAEDVSPNEPITKKTGRKLVGITVVLALVAAGWFVFQLFRPSLTADSAAELDAKGRRTIPEMSVAVMPLVNTSGDSNNEYFSDGLSEELIAVLARIPGLKVIGRSSSFLFKGKSDNSASIGQKLGVAQLIQGSVRRQGNRVRIIAEMISARNGEALWSETYDREVKDIFAVQSEIAQAVAVQLKIRLLGEKPASDSARSNPSPAAHDALLQSRFYFNESNTEGFRKAVRYAEEATRLDSNYAEAWARLSIAWRNYAVSGAPDYAQACASARVAADKAFALDPDSIDPLMAMQGVAMTPGLDFASAERYGRRAHELAPGDVTGLLSLSSALIAQGKLQEADPLLREVIAADPLQPFSHLYGLVLVGLHRYREAREVFDKILETHPKAARAHTQLATLDILENNPTGALEQASLEQEGGFRDTAVTMALQAGSDKSAADTALQDFISKHADAAFQVAIFYAQRHDPDKMFQWLETAYANRDGALPRLFVIPFLIDYRDDPRFAAFCRKLGIENLPPKP